MRLTTMSPLVCAVLDGLRMRALWLAALLTLANAALANDCDMQLSTRDVNYGAIHRGELATGARLAPISLGKRQLTLTVICRQPTAIGLRFEGQPAGAEGYRFSGQGYFTVQLKDATVDGLPVQLAPLSQSGGTDAAMATLMMRPDAGVVAFSQGVRAVGKVFSAQVEIDTYVDDATTRVRDVRVLEGQGTFILVAP